MLTNFIKRIFCELHLFSGALARSACLLVIFGRKDVKEKKIYANAGHKKYSRIPVEKFSIICLNNESILVKK